MDIVRLDATSDCNVNPYPKGKLKQPIQSMPIQAEHNISRQERIRKLLPPVSPKTTFNVHLGFRSVYLRGRTRHRCKVIIACLRCLGFRQALVELLKSEPMLATRCKSMLLLSCLVVEATSSRWRRSHASRSCGASTCPG